MKEFNVWPNASVVMTHLDNIMRVIGYSKVNGKGTQGYYQFDNDYQRLKNVSFEKARNLGSIIHWIAINPTPSLKRDINGRVMFGDLYLTKEKIDTLRQYINENYKEAILIQQLVYHKKQKKISLVGHNEFSIYDL